MQRRSAELPGSTAVMLRALVATDSQVRAAANLIGQVVDTGTLANGGEDGWNVPARPVAASGTTPSTVERCPRWTEPGADAQGVAPVSSRIFPARRIRMVKWAPGGFRVRMSRIRSWSFPCP